MSEFIEQQKLGYSVPEAGQLLGIGRNLAYEAAKTGEIPTVKIGNRLIVPKAALDRMLSNAGQELANAA